MFNLFTGDLHYTSFHICFKNITIITKLSGLFYKFLHKRTICIIPCIELSTSESLGTFYVLYLVQIIVLYI